jgi:hypothetical protein
MWSTYALETRKAMATVFVIARRDAPQACFLSRLSICFFTALSLVDEA